MSILEEKKIVIKLPKLQWRQLFSFRILLVFSLLFFSFLFAYWYRNLRPFFWIPSAHIETYSLFLHSDMEGRIAEMGPQEGDLVKKGQTLFVLDRDLLLAKQVQAKWYLDSLNAQIKTENERMGNAMEEYLKAVQELEMGGGGSDQVKKQLALMEEAQEKTETARSKLEAAKMKLSLCDLQLKKMVLTAPFDGIVLKRLKNPGAVVSFGEPVYLLADPERTWIEAEVPEKEIGRIAVGTMAKIRLPAYPKKEWIGKVAYISPATVAKGSQLPFSGKEEAVSIKISIQNPEIALKPGFSARVGLKVR